MAEKTILLAHGGGGTLMRDLLAGVVVKELTNPILSKLDDSAALSLAGHGRIAFTTDSYVVKPIFFRGGDIGRLAVCGTVNDLAMSGAQPKFISLAFIIEEGFPLSDLRRIVQSVKQAAQEAEVAIVTGDTKVVEKGGADRIFINTAGIGLLPEGVDISVSSAQPGDTVLLSGFIGDHGVAIMSEREGIAFETPVSSDVAPLGKLVSAMLKASQRIHCLKDPTRGGVAAALNEFASASKVGIRVFEDKLRIRPEVRGACDMLGFDPLYVANEGKLLALCHPADAQAVLAAMRATAYGAHAQVIGEVTAEKPGLVVLRTAIGGTRIVDWPYGEQLPRIC